jgi:hypothetical protein
MFEKPGSYLLTNKICPNMEQVVCSFQGVLTQAKHGDELFREISCSQCAEGALISFLLRQAVFGGAGVRIFICSPTCSP